MNIYKLNYSFLTVIFASLIISASFFSFSNNAQAFAAPEDLSVGIVYYCDDEGRDGLARLAESISDDDRFSSVSLLDGAEANPNTQFLSEEYDCVLAITNDNPSCIADPTELLENAGTQLAGYANQGGGLVLMSFSFSLGSSLGLGSAIFEPGLSPFQGAAFSNGMAGPVDIAGASLTPPACGRMLDGVGPFSTTLNNEVDISPGASLCASYDNEEEFLSINQRGNIVGLNAFPSNEEVYDESYGLVISNALYEVCSFDPAKPIPTMSEWAMITFAALVGVFGLVALRRRSASAKG